MHFGKTVENRTWPTSHRGPLLIHAAKSRASYDGQTQHQWKERYRHAIPIWESLVTGAILGRVDLVDCVRVDPDRPGCLPGAEPNEWVEGPVCWVLQNPIAFDEPIPYRGMQGLFEVPDGIVPVTGYPGLGPSPFPVDR